MAIQTTTMNTRKISAGNPDIATIKRIEMFLPVVCPFVLLWAGFVLTRYFLVDYIRRRHIDTTSCVFPRPSRLNAIN